MSPAKCKRVRRQFGQRVAEVRRQLAMTQEGLAERLEVTPRYIQMVEAGDENLTIDSLVKLSSVLRVTIGELFEPPVSREVKVGRPKRVR